MKCCCLGASSVYTIKPYTSLQCHFIQGHIGRVYVCLAVTCHLRFWQNDWDLLRATVVIRGWNGYRNKRQHRKLTLEKKILPPLLPGPEPGACFSMFVHLTLTPHSQISHLLGTSGALLLCPWELTAHTCWKRQQQNTNTP